MAYPNDSDNNGDARTLPLWLQLQADQRGAAVALRHKRLGLWEERRWSDVANEVRQLAAALAARSFGAGDTLLLLSHPRPEALLLSLAAQWLGGTAVPLDPAQPQQELSALLRHLQATYVFAEDQQQLDLILAAGPAPALILYADPRGLAAYRVDALASYAAFLEQAPTLPGVPVAQQQEHSAFVFYRLDAQGKPRSQSLSHVELLRQGRVLVEAEQLTHREEALAARAFAASGQARYLLAPWLIAGFRLNFPENLATRDNDRCELGPTLVAGTRETYQRLEQMVHDRLPEAGSWWRRLIDRALASDAGPLARVLGYWLVRRPLREVIGFTRTRAPLLVGEPLPESSARFFATLGVKVRHWPDPADWQSAAPRQPDTPGPTVFAIPRRSGHPRPA